VLRQVGQTFELPIATKLIATYARTWAASKRDFVLIDEVEDWLLNNDSDPALRYVGPHYECDRVEYFLIFQSYPEAFSFLLRWA
jgi:hypothetical protein